MLHEFQAFLGHAMHRGGPMMWPILVCALLALILGTRDTLRLLRASTRLAVKRRLEALVKQGRHDQALALCARDRHGSIERIFEAAIENAHRPQRALHGAVDQVAVRLKARIARGGRGLPILANVAILCAVLGSIEGFVVSFEAVAHASAESKDTLLMGFDRGETEAYRPSWELPGAARIPERNEHEDHGIGGMKLTAMEPRSTFGVDVDTASYALVRAQIDAGWLPEPAAVRVEEFVNAMPYSYASKAGPAPFAVYLEAAPDPFLPDRHLFAVGLKGRIYEGTRPPMNLVFLVDSSGSMYPANRLPLAQETLHTLVDGLREEDSISLATFAGGAELILPPTSVAERPRIHRAIDRLRSGGSTAMDDGLTLAYTLAREGHRPGCENRVVMLSDGGANVGLADHEAILEGLGELRGSTTLTTVGFGMRGYRDDLMEQLANQGDGNAFYVDSRKEARRVFGERLTSNLLTIARDVKAQIEFDPDIVLAWRLLGYENRTLEDDEFRDDAIDAGELGPGHEVTALYQLALTQESAGGDLAVVRLRARPPEGNGPAEEWLTELSAQAMAESFGAASPDLHAAFSAAAFAELLRESPWVEDLDYGGLRVLAERHHRGVPEDEELVGLIAKAGEIAGGEGR